MTDLLIERLNEVQEWMRQPDFAENFNLLAWLNARPTHVIPAVAPRVEALQAENDKLRAERDEVMRQIEYWQGRDAGAQMIEKSLEAEVARLTAALAAEKSRSGRLAEAVAAALPFLRRLARFLQCKNSGQYKGAWTDDGDRLEALCATLAALKEKTDAQ